MLRRTGTIAVCIAVLSLAAPAAAQDIDKRDHPRHHHKDRKDGDGLGDLFLGALIVGSVLALDAVSREHGPDLDTDLAADPGSTFSRWGPPGEDRAGAAAAVAQARCAEAIEAEGRKYAPAAWVSSVDEYWTVGRRWTIKGKVELAQSESDPTARRYKFRCSLRADQQPRVTIAGLTPADPGASTLREADSSVQRRDSQAHLAFVIPR